MSAPSVCSRRRTSLERLLLPSAPGSLRSRLFLRTLTQTHSPRQAVLASRLHDGALLPRHCSIAVPASCVRGVAGRGPAGPRQGEMRRPLERAARVMRPLGQASTRLIPPSSAELRSSRPPLAISVDLPACRRLGIPPAVVPILFKVSRCLSQPPGWANLHLFDFPRCSPRRVRRRCRLLPHSRVLKTHLFVLFKFCVVRDLIHSHTHTHRGVSQPLTHTQLTAVPLDLRILRQLSLTQPPASNSSWSPWSKGGLPLSSPHTCSLASVGPACTATLPPPKHVLGVESPRRRLPRAGPPAGSGARPITRAPSC